MPEPNPTGPPWDPQLGGIVDCREMFSGRSRSAGEGGNPQYTRVFLVRTNTINPSLYNVAAATGISWYDPHPNDANAILVESNATQEGESPFVYKVTYQYRYLDQTEKVPWMRPALFSFSGSLASAPCFWHYPTAGDNNTKRVIINTAGDPLGGLDKDEGEFSVTIQYNQKPPFIYARAQEYVGAINSDVWSGGQPKTWKVQSISAARKIETISGQSPNDPPVKVIYYDTSISIAYRPTGWDLQTWDVGFNYIQGGSFNASLGAVTGGTRRKIMAGSEPVSEPAALTQGREKAPGLAPDLLTFRIYKTLPFVGIFYQIPTDTPSGYPYGIPQPAVT